MCVKTLWWNQWACKKRKTQQSSVIPLAWAQERWTHVLGTALFSLTTPASWQGRRRLRSTHLPFLSLPASYPWGECSLAPAFLILPSSHPREEVSSSLPTYFSPLTSRPWEEVGRRPSPSSPYTCTGLAISKEGLPVRHLLHSRAVFLGLFKSMPCRFDKHKNFTPYLNHLILKMKYLD